MMLLRTAGVAAASVAAGPLVLMVFLLLGGTFVGGRLAETADGALVWATIVTTLITVVSAALLVFGIVAVGVLHRRAHLPQGVRASAPRVGRSLLGAARTFPRLALALLLTLVALVLATILALPASAAALIVAVVLFVRNARVREPEGRRFTRGTRIALVAAIPSVPTLALLLLLPALLAATLDAPRSLRALVRTAIIGLRQRLVPLLLFVVVGAGVSAGLTWAGTAASRAIDGDGTSATGLLVLAAILAALLALTGMALAVIVAAVPGASAATTAGTSAPRRPWQRTLPLTAAGGRVAMLVVVALVAGVVPAVTVAAPAQAAGVTPSTAVAPALIEPVLSIGFDGFGATPVLSAEVTVPDGDPMGTVQFLDGAVPLGARVALALAPGDPHVARASLSGMAPLDPGSHPLSFSFEPAGTAVAAGTSNVRIWSFLADTEVTISTDAAAAVNGPATVTVTVAPTYATSMKPDGTVDLTIDGTTETLTLVDGSAEKQVTLLSDPYITADYAGSALFKPSSGHYQVGAVIVPDPTQIVATVYNPPFTLGTVINASAVVTAPNADYGTVVKGTIQVWAGQTLLTESSKLTQTLSIPTTALHAGSTDLRFAFVPATGFEASETTSTITIAPARTSVSAALQPASSPTLVPRGSAHAMTVDVTSDLDGPRTVEVRNTRTSALVATGSVTVTDQHGTGSVVLTGLLPIGSYTLAATVVGDADHAPATSAGQTVSIGAGLTSTTLTISAGAATVDTVEIGTPVTLVATTTATAGETTLPGAVTFTLPDRSSARVDLAADGTARYTFTPTQASTAAVQASYFDTTSQYEPSNATGALTVALAIASTPVAVWTGDLTPSDRTLTLSYAAAPNRAVPTGGIRILDASGGILATGNLADGSVTLRLSAPGAHPVLRAEYTGDGLYATRTDVVPVSALRNYTPVITVGAPASAPLGTAFPVTVDLSGVPLDLVTQVNLTATAPDATVSDLGTITLDTAGHGTAAPTLLVAGAHGIRAVVTFTAASELAPAASDPAVTTVQPVPVPQLTVSRTDPGAALVAGASVELTITAAWLSFSSTGLAAGTRADLLDATGTVIGTTQLFGSPEGLSGTVTVANLRGGTLAVHASVEYGPLRASTSSPVLDLAVSAPTTDLSLAVQPVTVGDSLTVTVTAEPSGTLTGSSRSVPATVTVLGTDYPLSLIRSGATGFFRGTVAVPTLHAGSLALSASTPGDGVDTSAATADLTGTVDKRATSVAVVVPDGARAGDALPVSARVLQAGSQTSPAPTGTIILTGSNDTLCAADGTGACTLPGASVRMGENTLYAHYDGDADNEASHSVTQFTASARGTDLAVTFSPTPDEWVYGEPITASWTTTTTGAAAVGRVYFDLPGVGCNGPALAGSCTLTPVTTAQSAPVSTEYTVTFISRDDAPGAVVSGTADARLCVYPIVFGTIDYSNSVRCGDDKLGVVTGSLLRATAYAHPDYAVDSWTIDGSMRLSQGRSFLFVVTGFIRVGYTEHYAPTCFTLKLTPTVDWGLLDPYAQGWARANTRPNCASPYGSTAQELADQKTGFSRYAAGTIVDLTLVPANLSEEHTQSELELDTLTGATLTGPYSAQVAMTADRAVAATFRVKACTVVDLPVTEGGSVAVTAADRPSTSWGLKPSSGACTVGGEAGYVPGTKITVVATAKPTAAFGSWLGGSSRDNTATTLLAAPTGKLLTSAATTATTQLTVPWEDRFQVGAQFSMVKCVTVTVVSKAIRDYFAARTGEPAGATWAKDGPLTQCGDVASTTTTSNSALGGYHVVTTTDSMVATGRLSLTTTQPEYGIMGWRGYTGNTASVRWSSSTEQGVVWNGNPGTSGGTTIDLARVNSAITLTAGWYNASCKPPIVSLPQGGSYMIAPLSADESYCERAGELPRGQAGYLLPAAIAGSPNLVPITSMVNASGLDEMAEFGTSQGFFEGRAKVYGGGSYRLEYCAPIGLNVRVIDDSGQASALDPETAKKIVVDDGGCPPLYSRPGRTVTTAVTVAGQYTYSVGGSTDGTGPTRVVDAQGNVSGPNTLDLTIICYTISGKDLSATTPGNCPGGAGNRYTRGTTVQLQAEDIEGNRFDGWDYADASRDQTAWVIMDRDRYVEAKIHRYSTREKVGNWFSSISQRMLAAVITVATGVSLAQLMVAKVAAVGLKLAAAGLRAAGAGGAVADAIDKAGTVIQAQVDLAMLATKCLNDWANGKGEILTLPSSNSATPTLGAGAGLGPNATAEDIFNAAKADLQTRIAAKTGYSGAVPIGAVTSDVGTFMNVVGSFGENLSMYGSDAKTNWSSYEASMKACMAEGVDSYVKDTYTGY
ncbi:MULTISPECIES: hypothetical protein [unclassified Cryobacterium]|nr:MULTISPECIES: hypothetical protein [unclassified Cryobacterium]MDY7526471.1 hypothetical protein [Cryobacterium sp. 10C2]MEB0291133.1 hypothetical protein [Cryobacterium sp. 10C2]WPX13925.1 hypothetical protein RHM57_00690 [Cryobacterium sp. 10S3]